MDLVNDLGSDLAIAFLVEKKHSRKIALREAMELIDRVCRELDRPPRLESYGNEGPVEDGIKAAAMV